MVLAKQDPVGAVVLDETMEPWRSEPWRRGDDAGIYYSRLSSGPFQVFRARHLPACRDRRRQGPRSHAAGIITVPRHRACSVPRGRRYSGEGIFFGPTAALGSWCPAGAPTRAISRRLAGLRPRRKADMSGAHRRRPRRPWRRASMLPQRVMLCWFLLKRAFLVSWGYGVC
jgi:hypothetical protein